MPKAMKKKARAASFERPDTRGKQRTK